MTEFIENISGRSFDNTPNTSPINGTLNLLHAGYILVNSGTYVRYGEVNCSHYDESYLHQFAYYCFVVSFKLFVLFCHSI